MEDWLAESGTPGAEASSEPAAAPAIPAPSFDDAGFGDDAVWGADAPTSPPKPAVAEQPVPVVEPALDDVPAPPLARAEVAVPAARAADPEPVVSVEGAPAAAEFGSDDSETSDEDEDEDEEEDEEEETEEEEDEEEEEPAETVEAPAALAVEYETARIAEVRPSVFLLLAVLLSSLWVVSGGPHQAFTWYSVTPDDYASFFAHLTSPCRSKSGTRFCRPKRIASSRSRRYCTAGFRFSGFKSPPRQTRRQHAH
jgi:hypothetical protein